MTAHSTPLDPDLPTTPFDMVVLNDLNRFHLASDVIDRVPGLGLPSRKKRS